MEQAKKSANTNLAPEVIADATRKGLRKCVRDIVKSVLFWGISLAILFFTAAQNPIFTWKSQPFWFSLVFLILLAIPILAWKPYRILTERDFRGTLVSYRNKRVVDSSVGGARGIIFNSRQLRAVDVYIIKVQDERGRTRTFTFKEANTEFARVYYQKGDVLFCPRLANLPFNESRPLPRPLCLWCGSIGSPNETECKCCRAPYALIPEQDGDRRS